MDWYYMDKGQEKGPLGKEKMQELVRSGTIVRDTHVRNGESKNWTTYGRILDATANRRRQQAQTNQGTPQATQDYATQSYSPDKGSVCTECGGAFAEDELLSYQDARVCASCKPVFFQKLKEGVAETTFMDFAGFWIRFGAKIIDNIILGVANMIIGMVAGLLISSPAGASSDPSEITSAMIGGVALLYFLQIAVAAGYTSFFLGKYSATPGKMALGIKVVRPDGSSISYMRGFGRYFAEILSAAILAIGYIMAAFDKEKRALHDHICDTRVIRK